MERISGSTDLCECVSKQQAHEKWTNDPCLKHSSPFHLHYWQCNWSMHSRCQRPHIDFHDRVMAAPAGLDLPAYITMLLFSASALSCAGLRPFICRLSAARMYGAIALLICIFFLLFITLKYWEAVICIYIRSLNQANGLLAEGVLVFPSTVSSDSTYASSGSLCTACFRQWSLSSSKLSHRLSLSHSTSLSFLFWSLFPLSHITMCYLHCHCLVYLCVFISLALFCVPLCAISTALHYLFILSL